MEAFLLFIFKAALLLIAACGALYLWAAPKERRQRLEEEEAKERNRLGEIRYKAQLEAFVAEHMTGWNAAPASVNGHTSYIAMSDNGMLIRYVCPVLRDSELVLNEEKTFSTRSILSFNVVQPDKTKTVVHNDKVPLVTRQKRSTVGRAVVGGVLLGPVGAVVGAASGGNGKDKVIYKTVERKETITVKGRAQLILGLKDISNPKLVIQFEEMGLATEWWYKIQSVNS